MLVDDGVLQTWDSYRRLLARVRRSPSRLYMLILDITRLLCLATRGSEEAWCWHARYGHLNFQSLCKLSKQAMVRGLLRIDHIDQVCDGCLAEKQR